MVTGVQNVLGFSESSAETEPTRGSRRRRQFVGQTAHLCWVGLAASLRFWNDRTEQSRNSSSATMHLRTPPTDFLGSTRCNVVRMHRRAAAMSYCIVVAYISFHGMCLCTCGLYPNVKRREPNRSLLAAAGKFSRSSSARHAHLVLARRARSSARRTLELPKLPGFI